MQGLTNKYLDKKRHLSTAWPLYGDTDCMMRKTASFWTVLLAKHAIARTRLNRRNRMCRGSRSALQWLEKWPLTSVRSSGKWKVSLISSGDFPSIILARALEVNSTSCFSSRLSAADVSSQRRLVSSLMNFSSNSLRSCPEPIRHHQMRREA